MEKTVSLAHGLGYWAVLLAALIAVTWLLFRRRDVVLTASRRGASVPVRTGAGRVLSE